MFLKKYSQIEHLGIIELNLLILELFVPIRVFIFVEFIQGVSQFSVKGDKESKLRFAFRIYDMDNDGYISNGELFQVSFFFLEFLNFIHFGCKSKLSCLFFLHFCRYLK